MVSDLESRERVRVFYDSLSKKLLGDYTFGNRRVEAAIHHSIRWIPADAKRILDIGCGVGWSTWEIKRHRSGAIVVGVDQSPKMIELARKLFVADGLSFVNSDITQSGSSLEYPYDALIMIDVYEHISRELRASVHNFIDEALAEDGVLILTFPSISHQRYLRTLHPEQLQPVDEDITEPVTQILANAINGRVVHYRNVHIWQPNDYVHVAIVRGHPSRWQIPQISAGLRLESQPRRKERVNTALQVRPTRSGIMLANQAGPKVCIVSPSIDKYSETYIQSLMERLHAKVMVLYGGFFPRYDDSGELILPLASRAADYLVRGFSCRFGAPRLNSLSDRLQMAGLEGFLRRHEVDVTLAEYGPTGVEVMGACQAVGIPLIVHFHGFDAYDQATLQRFAQQYLVLADQAAAIVVVSRDMKRQLLSLGMPCEKICYNPPGADTTLFQGGEPASAPPTFLAVGRLVRKKAPHLTLKALAKVLEQCSEARLVVIGEGELLEESKQMAATMGISEQVNFRGSCAHSQVALAMRNARSFVQHSIRAAEGDSEGTPATIIEAGATGIPVVATSHAGIKDIVIHGETGFLVEEGDVEGMARYMLMLAQDPELAARIGQRAQEHIRANYSAERSLRRLDEIIMTAIRKNRA